MFKKIVPLAALLGSSLAVDNYITGSQWAAGASPNFSGTAGTASGNAVAASVADCCLFKGTVSVSTDNKISGTANPALSGTPAEVSDPCYAFRTLINTGTLTAQLTNPPTAENAAATTTAVGDGAAGLSVATTNSGTTLTITWSKPSANYKGTGAAAAGGLVAGATCAQTLTRSNTAVSSDFAGSWTIADGALTQGKTADDCCFFATTTPLAVTSAGVTSGAKTGTSAACSRTNSEYATTLEQGATASVALPRLNNGDTFTLSGDKKTITFVPEGTAGCAQTLTKVSSSANKIAAMTPVVVGAAVLGLAVL